MPKKESAPGGTPAQDLTDRGAVPPESPLSPQQAKPDCVLYIGPTMLRPALLQHKSVYTGGIPQAARELAAKDADLAGCFVPMSEAGKALRELEGYPGTIAGDYSRRYRSVQKRYLQEVKK